MRVRRNDQVVVIAGEDKGKTGRVLRVLRDDEKVVVEGVNFIKRHQRATQTQQAGIIEREAPIHVSNVMIVDPAGNGPTRVGREILADGKRQRVSRKSGEVITDNEG